MGKRGYGYEEEEEEYIPKTYERRKLKKLEGGRGNSMRSKTEASAGTRSFNTSTVREVEEEEKMLSNIYVEVYSCYILILLYFYCSKNLLMTFY